MHEWEKKGRVWEDEEVEEVRIFDLSTNRQPSDRKRRRKEKKTTMKPKMSD